MIGFNVSCIIQKFRYLSYYMVKIETLKVQIVIKEIL